MSGRPCTRSSNGSDGPRTCCLRSQSYAVLRTIASSQAPPSPPPKRPQAGLLDHVLGVFGVAQQPAREVVGRIQVEEEKVGQRYAPRNRPPPGSRFPSPRVEGARGSRGGQWSGRPDALFCASSAKS